MNWTKWLIYHSTVLFIILVVDVLTSLITTKAHLLGLVWNWVTYICKNIFLPFQSDTRLLWTFSLNSWAVLSRTLSILPQFLLNFKTKSRAEKILIKTYIIVMMMFFSSIKRFGNGFLKFVEFYLFSRRLILREVVYPKPVCVFSFYTATPPSTK